MNSRVNVCVIDVDGTVIDSSKRFEIAKKGNKIDWKIALSETLVKTLDKPMPKELIDKIISICKENECSKIIFVTGRPETLREITINQIRKIGFKKFELIMRKKGDYRSEIEYKLDILDKLLKSCNVKVWIDDNEEVLKNLKIRFQLLKTYLIKNYSITEYVYSIGYSIENFLK